MLFNLLQRGFNPPPPGANAAVNQAALVGGIVGGCIGLVLFAAVVAAAILVLVRSMQALQEVRKRNRTMEPGMVWLTLIPFFGIVWIFMVVTKTADALADEFDDRRLRSKGDFGKSAGMTYATLSAVNAAIGFLSLCVPFVGCVNLVLGIVQIVFGVKYAGKLKIATQRLREDADDDRPDDDFEEADDEPAPRRKPKKKLDDDFEEFDEPKGGR